MSNQFYYLFQYLEKDKIFIDQTEFEFQIQSHPNYPSLLAISDTLSFYFRIQILNNHKKQSMKVACCCKKVN